MAQICGVKSGFPQERSAFLWGNFVPELPELELLKVNLERMIAGKCLEELRILKPYIQKTVLSQGLAGQKVTAVTRRGKYITIDLEEHRLIVHLMLAGRFRTLEPDSEPLKTAAAVLVFENTGLQLVEDAKLKRMSLWVVAKDFTVDDLRPLGPEPLSDEFTSRVLAGLVASSRERLKMFLVNQANIAGIGNAYADEICWQAQLSPFKQTYKLTAEETDRLYKAIRDELLRAQNEAAKLTGEKLEINEERRFLSVHRRRGQPCPRCGTEVEWVSTQARDTYYCPCCQTDGKVLKDNRTSKFLK